MSRSGPGGFFLATALCWLVLGLALSGAAAATWAWPVFSWKCALALARFAPAGGLALRLGWASLAGAGLGLGILHARRPCTATPLLWSAAVLWNGSLLMGVGGILAGKEMPGWQAGLAAAALLLGIGAWRQPRLPGAFSSIAESYALAAFAALPLCLGGKWALSFFRPDSGMGAVIGAAWGDGAFFGLWLAPLALAVLYASWPEEGVAMPHAGPAALGFLIQIGAAGWTGTAQWVGGPAPLWIGSVATAACLFMLLPALAIPLSLAESRPVFWTGPRQALAAAAAAYVLFLVHAAWLALLATGPWQRTLCGTAQADLGLFGFVTLLFAVGSGRFFSPMAAWCGAGGLVLLLGAEEAGGWLQAFAAMNPSIPWSALTDLLHPFLILRAGGFLLILAAALTALFFDNKDKG